jgi:hypothetical protein
VTNTRDIDAAKERLVDSLSSARDIALTAVREDIAPAVAAAVEAARDASGPAYAEAASRAGDAMSALRGSDAVQSLRDSGSGGVKALRDSDTVQALAARASRPRAKRRRWPIMAALVAAGVAGAAVLKRRGDGPTLIDVTDAPPTTSSSKLTDDAPTAEPGPSTT